MKIGRYEIERELGKGAMGVVFLARDPIIGRQLAIKTFRIGFQVEEEELQQFRERFLREAQSAGILSHPGIVTIHDVVVEEETDSYYIAMEYVEGTDLKQILRQHTRLEPKLAARTVAKIAEGLDYAHSRGVVHRDIKPANIIVTADHVVKITDFGIARLDTSNLTMEGQLLGTPNYMAPEQVRGREVDHRADIFALGVMFFEMLTGRKPFAGENLTAVSHNIVHEPHPRPTDFVEGLPEELVRVVDRALQKKPDDRYARGQEMFDEIQAALDAIEVRESRPPTVDADDMFTPVPEPPPPPGPPPAEPEPPPSGEVLAPLPDLDTLLAPPEGNPSAGTIAVSSDRGSGETAPDPGSDSWLTSAPPAPVPPEKTGPFRTTPLRAAVAATVGLVLSGVLALVLGTFEPPPMPPDDNDPNHVRRREVLPLLQAGRVHLDAGEAAAALEALDRAVMQAPELSEVRRLRERADREVLALEGLATEDEFLEVRTREAEDAEKRRDWAELADLADRILAVAPKNEEALAFRDRATEMLERRAAVRVGARGETPPRSATPTAPPRQAEAAQVVLDFQSERSSGILSVFSGSETVLREEFDFGEEKRGLFRRSKPKSGTFVRELRVPAAADLRVMVYLSEDERIREVDIDGTVAAGGRHRLTVRIDEHGRVQTRLE